MKGQLDQVQSEMTQKRFTADVGGGAVTATVDGKCTLVDIKIQPEAAKDIELLEDMVKSSVASACRKAQEAMQQEMAKLTGGLNIPGLGDLVGGAGTPQQ